MEVYVVTEDTESAGVYDADIVGVFDCHQRAHEFIMGRIAELREKNPPMRIIYGVEHWSVGDDVSKAERRMNFLSPEWEYRENDIGQV